MLKKVLVIILALLFGGGIWVSNSQGENYPTRPIEILCPYSAGSSVDIMIRLVADIAQKYLGQPMVVINKPGASGTIAAAEIISSKADGYKLVELTNLFFATTTKTQKVSIFHRIKTRIFYQRGFSLEKP
jgi:tripartite-type tricarboxylate transporter receptor subunit TctC